VAVLLGGVAIRWYAYVATASILNDLKKAESDAVATGNVIIVNAMIGIRSLFEGCGLVVSYVVGFCVLGVGVGLLLGVRRMWLCPSAEAQVEVSFPRQMVITLAWQMIMLWIAAILTLVFLFVARLIAF